MRAQPYQNLPNHAYWRRAVADVPPQDIDPVVDAPFRISPRDKVATAGSCFAQHIARHLRRSGFNFLVTEPAHPIAPPEAAEAHGYGIFTARYGNLYTSRQLLQLFRRAYGSFVPSEDVWTEADGRLTDPFRPLIQSGRFLTAAEYRADRQRHFACVREAFEQLDVLVFTLGLTETWCSREDGAVYPLCPGVAGGTFDPERHGFLDLSVADVTADLVEFSDLLGQVNPTARILLTVSPVPLIATAKDTHVLASTTYSKSVLRVAADEAARQRSNIAYFPSYEIISGPASRGAYFGPDCRSVTEEGVEHVMRTFMRHYTEGSITGAPPRQGGDAGSEEMRRMLRLACEEEALDPLPGQPGPHLR